MVRALERHHLEVGFQRQLATGVHPPRSRGDVGQPLREFLDEFRGRKKIKLPELPVRAQLLLKKWRAAKQKELVK
jgi:hypothetical protein